MKHWLFLGVAIVGEVVATSALKASDGFSRPLPSVAVVSGYCLAFYFLSLALREIPVGVAYAIWSGIGIVLIAGFAWIFQGQKLDLAAVAGMTLIICGVVVMNIFSKVQAH
jgi:small multidrug resistance pump